MRSDPNQTPSEWRLGLLVVSAVVVALELVRVTGPVLDQVFAADGVRAAAAAAVVTYLAPGVLMLLAALAVRLRPQSSERAVVPVLVTALVVARLIAQAFHGGIALSLATIALGIAALVAIVTLACARPGGGRLAAVSIAVGVSVSTALQLVFTTLDAYWREGPDGWAVTLLMVAVLGWATVMVFLDPGCLPTWRPGRLWAIGPFLAVGTLTVGSLAFTASQTGFPLRVAGPILVAAWLVAAAVAARGSAVERSRRATVVVTVLLLLLLAVALAMADGTLVRQVLVTVAAFLCPTLLVLLLAPALDGGESHGWRGPVWSVGVAGATAVGGLGVVLPLLLYQMDYNSPLGYPNDLTILAAAALVGVTALREPRVVDWSPASGWVHRLLVAGAASGVLATGVAAVTAAAAGPTELDAEQATRSGEIRVLVWNIHYGVDVTGRVDVDALVDTVERHDPDVVLLNEVARGWVIGGGTDLSTLLQDRLGGHFVYAPAADRQFGNAIAARWPLRDVRVHRLPYGEGPQYRSAVSAKLRTPSGELTVIATHLQQKKERSATRLLQLRTLLPALDVANADSMVVAGDFNARVGDPEIAMMTGAGWVSAVDEVGDPSAMTIPSIAPTARYDWIFGRGVRFREARVLTGELASDHLPVMATLVP